MGSKEDMKNAISNAKAIQEFVMRIFNQPTNENS